MNEALFSEPTASQPLPHSVEAEQAVSVRRFAARHLDEARTAQHDAPQLA